MSSHAIFLIIAAAIAWILAVKTGEGLAFSMAYLFSGILVLSYLWARSSIRAVHIQRFTRSRRSQVGQFAEEHFDVSNRGWLPKLWLEVEDFSTLPWHSEASRVINGLGRGRTYRWQVKTLCTQRGQLSPRPHAAAQQRSTWHLQCRTRTVELDLYCGLSPDCRTHIVQSVHLGPAGGEAQHRRAMR